MGRRWLTLPLLCLLPTLAAAATIRVPEDRPTVAAGLDVAEPGDTVLLAPGTYHESNLELPSRVTLRGASGRPEGVVIDAQGAGRVLACRSATPGTRIESLTLTGGRLRRRNADAAGLWVTSGSTLAVTDCRIERNNNDGDVDWSAMGVGIVDSWVTLERCSIAENGLSGAEASTAGIACWHSIVALIDCEIRDNSGFQSPAGGLLCRSGSAVTAQGCAFTGNWATRHGAIAVEESSLELLNCTLDDNAATYEGGGIYTHGAQLDMENCLVAGGHSADFGGGLLLENSTVTITGSTIARNRTDSGAYPGTPGGGLRCLGSTVTLTHSVLWGNCADIGSGHDAQVVTGSLTFDCCVVNPAMVLGAASYLGGCIDQDPLYCAPADCGGAGGDYRVDGVSACLPAHNDCGVQLGARGRGCGETGVERTSWSALKARY